MCFTLVSFAFLNQSMPVRRIRRLEISWPVHAFLPHQPCTPICSEAHLCLLDPAIYLFHDRGSSLSSEIPFPRTAVEIAERLSLGGLVPGLPDPAILSQV